MTNQITYQADIFDGITLDASSLPQVYEELETQLDPLVLKFKAANKRIIWITLAIKQSHLISVFTDRQFHFHNCQDDKLTLTRCLQGTSEIPFKPTHTVGAGALVKSGEDILVVRETLSASKGYKLPGGHVDLGESIAEAAIREVHEETGVKARFVSVNGLMNKFPYRFEKANIYFVCHLEALTKDIHIHHPHEIADAKWVKIKDYLEDPDNGEFNKAAARAGFYGEGMQLSEISAKNTITDKREVLLSSI